MLKENALYWWASFLTLEINRKLGWIFKQLFASVWLTPTFEILVSTEWRNLNSVGCKDIDEYMGSFGRPYY